jgi:hypothetical protein
MNYLYLRAALDPAKAGQANLAYKISLGYFILRFGIKAPSHKQKTQIAV